MQIQYNITRIEEWCKSHDIPEGTLQLEHLMQTTKLLQFKKSSLEDIENIYDVCWILSPTQIQKLISNYMVADYEVCLDIKKYFCIMQRPYTHGFFPFVCIEPYQARNLEGSGCTCCERRHERRVAP